jgi:hypothetical protein
MITGICGALTLFMTRNHPRSLGGSQRHDQLGSRGGRLVGVEKWVARSFLFDGVHVRARVLASRR